MDSQNISVNGKKISYKENSILIALNKPPGYVCSHNDEKRRYTVFDLIRTKKWRNEKLIIAGRLDIKSRGLLLLTNNGNLADYIMHPRYSVLKEYIVKIKKGLAEKDYELLRNGIYDDRELLKPISCKIMNKSYNSTTLKLILSEGKYREIRRIFKVLRYTVKDIFRIRIGNIGIKGIQEGEYRLVKKEKILVAK